MIVLEDGSAKYNAPLCPSSNCSATMFYHDYMQNERATCSIGTEMILSLTGEIGVYDRCVTPLEGVELSGELPDGCYLIYGRFCCPAGGPYTLKFVHSSAPCQPSEVGGADCIYPQSGFAFGTCGNLDSCAVGVDAADIIQQNPTEAPSSAPSMLPTVPNQSPAPTEPPSPPPEFQVSVVNTGGGNSGVPRGEWICLQSRFCSYNPESLLGNAQSQFPDYDIYTQQLRSLTGTSTIVLEDGSAKYNDPVCPSSNCSAVIHYDTYMQNERATCSIGTEMILSLTGEFGDYDRCVTPSEGVELSGELPDGCSLSSGSYCCPAGGPYTLKFVHSSAPCQPSEVNGTDCIYPESGLAYGFCGNLDSCVVGVDASYVTRTPEPTALPSQLPTSLPTRLPTVLPSQPPSPPPDSSSTKVAVLSFSSFLLLACQIF